MFPISDSIKSKSFPIVTIVLIAINIYVFFQELAASSMEAFITRYSLIPSHINVMDYSTLITFISSMFLHGGFLHIISNMWFLWIFGDDVEDFFGKIPYLFLYLLSGLAGNILQYSMSMSSSIPMLGASGAISGVLGAYYVLFPHSKIKTFVFIFFFITIMDIPAAFYLFYWFIIQLFSGAASSTVSYQAGGVAFFAHIGGFIAGVLMAKLLQARQPKNYIDAEIVS